MGEPILLSSFLIQATIRTAACAGVIITVVQHGDDDVGSLMLKINLLNGTAVVLTSTRYNDEHVWIPTQSGEPIPDREADLYLEKQRQIDPDLWILEIEDKQGRVWFPGKLMMDETFL